MAPRSGRRKMKKGGRGRGIFMSRYHTSGPAERGRGKVLVACVRMHLVWVSQFGPCSDDAGVSMFAFMLAAAATTNATQKKKKNNPVRTTTSSMTSQATNCCTEPTPPPTTKRTICSGGGSSKAETLLSNRDRLYCCRLFCFSVAGGCWFRLVLNCLQMDAYSNYLFSKYCIMYIVLLVY